MLGWLFERFEEFGNRTALIYRDKELKYSELLRHIHPQSRITSEFSPQNIGGFLWRAHNAKLISFVPTASFWSHVEIKKLTDKGHAALVLATSGSSGKPKYVLHDLNLILEKFKTRRDPMRMLAFLMFDHIGGINTLLHCLSNGGCLITDPTRNPRTVINAIERFNVEVLPTSPTFLNMLILSGECEGRDLSGLKLITYGTEPMPESTLKAATRLFPNVKFQQTYGLSELGILRSKSKSSDSLWVRIGGEGFETRVRDGLLEIKAKSAMIGYLNAPSPFTEDGWFMTGDAVEQDGEWIRILGRKSEMINVGGLKVFPAEIESKLQEMPGVESAVVSGEANPITGNMVKAVLKLSTQETPSEFRIRMKEHLKDVEPYKVPKRIVIVEKTHNDRFKKVRV